MPRVDGEKLLQHLKFKLTLRTDWYCHQLKKHKNYPGIIFTIIFLVCFGVIIAFYGLEKQTNQQTDKQTATDPDWNPNPGVIPGSRYPLYGSR